MSASLDHGRFLAQRHFGALDGLRCLSIVAVVWHHTRPEIPGMVLDERGFLGVDMFFVLSGFLIVTLLLREQDRAGRISLRHFYLRRSFRIFPLYYGLIFAITAALLVRGTTTGMSEAWFRELPVLLTYTANWFDVTTLLSISWSLAAEEQFYLLWPPLLVLLGRRSLVVLGAALLIGQAIHFRLLDVPLAQIGVGPHDLPMLRQTGFTPILLGVALAHVMHDARGFARVAALLGARWTPVILIGALVVLMAATPDDIMGWPRLAIHLTMTLLLASCVVREDHALMPFLAWSPIARLGVISYGMYLLHKVAQVATESLLARVEVGFAGDEFLICFVGSVVLSELSFRYFETPFLRLKDRLGHPERRGEASA